MELKGKFDPKVIEDEIRSYLSSIDLDVLLQNESLDSKGVVGYIEGPPTMNGEPHAGHLEEADN